MESLERSKAIIDLGQRLVSALDLGDDPVSQWMAHVVAEQMDAVERVSPDKRALAQEACRQTILSLWERRASFPSHIRPFRELDPILQTLASLDVSSGVPFRYFPRHPSDEELECEVATGKRFLNVAVNLDYSARVLIHYLLSSAAQEAVETANPWLKAAIEADADTGLELRVVEFVTAGGNTPDTNEVAQQALLDKVERLELFSQLASALASELRDRLEPPEAVDDTCDA